MKKRDGSQMEKENQRIKIGISRCLLGHKVRFDGGHKQDRYLTDVLGPYVEWVPVCPEVTVGMGVPREAIRLVGFSDQPRLIAPASGADWSDKMNRLAHRESESLRRSGICGFVFKKDSPTCGLFRVKVYHDSGMATRDGVGAFARVFAEKNPLIPMEEEGRLNDAVLRENFVVRIFAYHRLQTELLPRFSIGKLVEFHSRHKFLLLAHSPSQYKELGRLVASAKKYQLADLKEKYAELFMMTLMRQATVKKNVNVLQHIMGFLHTLISPSVRQNILETITDYHHGIVPLVVPVTLINHYIKMCQSDSQAPAPLTYLADQIYLQPHPKELMLRNHV